MVTFQCRGHVKLVGLVVGILLVISGCVIPQPTGSGLTADQNHALDLVNSTRAQYGLPGLAVDWDARNKAQSWAEHLAAIGYLAHSDLAAGISGTWSVLGENVGQGASIQIVHDAYVGAAGHRANILDGRWTGVGTGVAYNSVGRTFTVQVFIQR